MTQIIRCPHGCDDTITALRAEVERLTKLSVVSGALGILRTQMDSNIAIKARADKAEAERDDANATALRVHEHACKVADEAKAGFAALEEEDNFWDACGYPNNRKVLTVSEQAASIIRERDAAIARAEKAEAALNKMREAEPDYWYRDRDPDESGDSAHNALTEVPDMCVCLLHSSYVGPSKYAFRAQTLCLDNDDDEVLLFDTEEEAVTAANQRGQNLKALKDFASLTQGE